MSNKIKVISLASASAFIFLVGVSSAYAQTTTPGVPGTGLGGEAVGYLAALASSGAIAGAGLRHLILARRSRKK